ncbi:hypothetical protein ACMV_34230 [Acidiphilium multivorum AIU301]|uniref:Methyltransferase type 12 n=2 Tax=Acidiphilium TaxID=522 RepID=A5G334_ACICJ|nr:MULTISPECIES: class I SAM-dependent methyltransferase [Acidiphilium]ABQ32266.1 Methyltransferase type 12 [Acidiphilium cryptum JF-5]EGO95953.1 Methyltransferase type 12 [Acidiphilium sp. PM]BAJ82770.1 hypothetical protein ACMV_34230 [Acidiphilium multivorum AIU301]GAN73941.1 type 12 methyltransferase [Acidiphilium multivorum AIU301]
MSWGSGYVTDIAYAPSYYVEQSPRLMALVALLTGRAARMAAPDESFHFLDIGSGRGFTALVLAATNPGWTVTGIDFNPGHVAAARDLAARAGIGNCRFIEADLARFDGADLAPVDAASLHGVWTWVDDQVRAGIVRLLAERLVPGGFCHVSYNVQPGWGGMIGLQRLMREAGRRLAFRADRQAERGFEIVRRLVGQDGERADEKAQAILRALADKPGAYLAHEFMNANWRPCFHADVVEAFAEAKFSYVGSPHLLDNFVELVLPPVALDLAREFEDPAMTELVKDLTLGRPLRHDIYVRGERRLATGARDQALKDLALGLSVPSTHRSLKFQTASGEATMNASFYEPVFARLAQGVARVGELLDVARPPGRSPAADNPAELVAMLVGTGQAVMVASPGLPMTRQAVALNAAMFAEQIGAGPWNRNIGLAVPALGGAFNLPAVGAFAVLRQHDWLSDATVGQALPTPDRATIEGWLEAALPNQEQDLRQAMADGVEGFLRNSRATLAALGLPC